MIAALPKVGLVTILALAEAACANRTASGANPIQSNEAAPKTTARNAPIIPQTAGGAPNAAADSGGTAAAAPSQVSSPESGAPAEAPAPPRLAAEPREAFTAPGPELLPWLIGRWKGKRKTCWPLTWNAPNELLARQQNRCNEAGVRFELELTFTEGPGKLDGLLEAVGEDGARHKVVAFVISRDEASCSLVWNEGGLRYVFGYEPARAAQTCFDGDPARFSLERGPTSRVPYPIGIQFWLEDRELKMRRLQGPQHGAPVDQIYAFGR